MRPILCALLLSTALLAGCAGTADPAPAGNGPAGSASPDGTASPEKTQRTSQPPTSADDLPSAVCRATVNAGAGLPGDPRSTYVGCAFEKAARGDLSRFGAALVEAAWPDPLPTVTGFQLFLLSDSCGFDVGAEPCHHGHRSSATPSIRHEVPAETLQEFGSDGLRAYASFEGVGVQQEIILAVTLVPAGQALPPDFSALP